MNELHAVVRLWKGRVVKRWTLPWRCSAKQGRSPAKMATSDHGTDARNGKDATAASNDATTTGMHLAPTTQKHQIGHVTLKYKPTEPLAITTITRRTRGCMVNARGGRRIVPRGESFNESLPREGRGETSLHERHARLDHLNKRRAPRETPGRCSPGRGRTST